MLDTLAASILENNQIKNLSLAFDFHFVHPIKVLTPAIQQELLRPWSPDEIMIHNSTNLLPNGELLLKLGNDLASWYPALQTLRTHLQASTAPGHTGKTRTFLQSVHDIPTGDIQCALDLHEREIELELEEHRNGRLA
jgi:hypothetical protein